MKKLFQIGLLVLGFVLISASLAILIPEFGAGVMEGGKVMKINIEGVITSTSSSGLLSGGNTYSGKIIDQLEKAEQSKNVRAVLLRINSPGGGAVASREIKKKVEDMGKPVVARIVSQGTSGAYWVASAADKTIADPLSLVGSIGVTSSYLEFSGLMEKYGIEYVRLVSGKYKDIGSQYRNLTEEERGILMDQIMEVDKVFREDIKENRNLTEGQFKKANSSKFYLGKKAKGIGLVDELGTREETEEELKKILNTSSIRYKEVEQGISIWDILFSSSSLSSLRGLKAVSRVPKFSQISSLSFLP